MGGRGRGEEKAGLVVGELALERVEGDLGVLELQAQVLLPDLRLVRGRLELVHLVPARRTQGINRAFPERGIQEIGGGK